MSAPVFGVNFTRSENEIQPAIKADFSRILVIETSENADPSVFPIGEPVRFSTGRKEMVAALGTGLLHDAVTGIHAQLDSLNAGADVTVVRVAEGSTPAETAANIAAIVEDIQSIPSKVKAVPRIVVAGRTAWRPDDSTTNPVIAALESNLGKILAIAPVDVDDSSEVAAVDARETMQSSRLMPIGIAARVWEGADQVVRPMAPRAAGLIVRIDNSVGNGLPFQPFANRPIWGLAGLSRPLPFTLTDGSTEGQRLLEKNVSIVAEGETSVDGAVGEGGFTFIGTDNAQSSLLWEQIHQVRGIDYITVQIINLTRNYLGRAMSAGLIEAYINSLDMMLKEHKLDGNILGYSPKEQMFQADSNQPQNLRLGHLKLNIGVEPVAAFKRADHELTSYAPALDELVQSIETRLSSAV
jgi:phage tail sheath protein FI